MKESRRHRVPSYRSLPLLPGTDVRHSWGVWGAADRLGTLNRLSDEACLRAMRIPRLGRRISLSLPLDEPEPPLFGRRRHAHNVFMRNRNMIEDTIDDLDLQASSQWDSLRHIAAREHGFYGGVTDWEGAAATALGIDNMAQLGLVARAVLLDVASYWADTAGPVSGFQKRAITAAELTATAAAQGSTFCNGDLLLVRTGWMAADRDGSRRQEGDRHDRSTFGVSASVGLEASDAMAEFLWDSGFCAVAADNPALEVLPADPAVGSLHRRLIPGLGMPIGELWDLDGLAAACRRIRRYECLVTAVPLYVRGGVGSPSNALAVL